MLFRSSATKNAPSDADWTTNSAGFHFNHKFGAGLINAKAAVTLATNIWQNLSPQINISSAQTNLSVAIPDNNSNGVTRVFDMTTQPALRVEHAVVTVNVLHSFRGDLAITLTSPSGTQSRLAEKHADPNDNIIGWKFMTVRNWGETSSGPWSVKVADLDPGGTGTVVSVQLDLYGTTVSPHLAVSNATAAVTLGNANGAIDPGETVAETILLRNLGTATASNIVATLSTDTPGVTLVDSLSGYHDLAKNNTGTNLTAYTYHLAKSVPAGTTINFTHIASTDAGVFTNTFSHIVGQLTSIYSTNSFTNSVANAITDPGTIYSTNTVSLPVANYIDDVDVFVRIDHPYDGDLAFGVQHPDGAEIMLSLNNGGSGNNYGSGSTPTTLDDSAASIIYEGTPAYIGTYRHEGRLADLNGKPANGVWQLRVSDLYSGDSGTLNFWGLRIISHTNQYSATLYNTPPVAYDATYDIPSDLTTDLTLLVDDADGDEIICLTNNVPIINPFPYTPPPGFTGTTNFTFAVTDTYATSSVATVTLEVISSSSDADGDGYTDWQEYLAGTDPQDASSALRLAASQPGNLQFNSVADKTYYIEYKDNLSDPQWTFLISTNGTGDAMQITDPDAAMLPHRFYRIRVIPMSGGLK